LNELQRKQNTGVGEARSLSMKKKNYLLKKEQEAQQRKIQNQLKKLEREIEDDQKKLLIIEKKLTQPELYAKEIENGTLYAEYEKLKRSITEKEELWLELHLND
jgi:C4-type Zn-finger protein